MTYSPFYPHSDWDGFSSSCVSLLSQIFFQDLLKNKFTSSSAKVSTRAKHVGIARKDEELNEAEIKNYDGLKELTRNQSMTSLLV